MTNRLRLHGMLAILVGLSGCASVSREGHCPCHPEVAAGRPVAQSAGDFASLNPHYKDRAGAFYDTTYVSPSAEALFKIAGVRPEQMPKSLAILRSFVDEWLGAYVEGNGSITQTEVDECVQRMDGRFDALFDDLQRKQYRIWRDDTSGEHNKLRFLMSRPQTLGEEPGVISLGDNEKAGEVLVLSTRTVVKLTAEQKSMQELVKIADTNESAVVYYDDASAGTLGFVGATGVAFVTNRTVQAVLAMTEKEVDTILDGARPMAYTEFMQKYQKSPPIPYPASPVQVAPSVVALLLRDRPGNVILCKASGQVFAMEVVGVTADKMAVHVKVHQKK